MRPSKWNCVTVLALLLIPRTVGGLNLRPPNLTTLRSSHRRPFWEDVLREFVFRTVSPSPSANRALYKGILEAPFYGGPFPEFPKDASVVVLSRGDVHHLPNGRWLMCQEGCFECKPCVDRRNPTVKWTLRRIKRLSLHNSPRYDLQITITPHRDDAFYPYVERNLSLWPRSYVYVTTQPEEFRGSWMDKEDPWLSEKYPFSRPVDDLPVWRFVEEDLLQENSTSTTVKLLDISGTNMNNSIPTKNAINTKNSSTTIPKLVSSIMRNFNDERRPPPQSNILDKRHSDSLTPQLILGRDNLGKKRLVHVVPAEYRWNSSMSPLTGQHDMHLKYRQLFDVVFDSLDNNKESIERFLQDKVTSGASETKLNPVNLTSAPPRFNPIKNSNNGNRTHGNRINHPLHIIRNSSDVRKMVHNRLNMQRIVHKRPQRYRRRPAPSFGKRAGTAENASADWNSKTIVGDSLGNGSNRTDARNETGSRSWSETVRGRFNEAPMGNDTVLESRPRDVPRRLRIIATTEPTTVDRSRVVNGTASTLATVEQRRGRPDATNDTVPT